MAHNVCIPGDFVQTVKQYNYDYDGNNTTSLKHHSLKTIFQDVSISDVVHFVNHTSKHIVQLYRHIIIKKLINSGLLNLIITQSKHAPINIQHLCTSVFTLGHIELQFSPLRIDTLFQLTNRIAHQINSINISFCRKLRYEKKITKLLDVCPNLKQLRMAGATINQLHSFSKNQYPLLTLLDISYSEPLMSHTDIINLCLKYKFPNLKCFVAARPADTSSPDNNNVSPETFKLFIESMPLTITHINLSGYVVAQNHLTQLCQYFNTNLVYLDVSMTHRPDQCPATRLQPIFSTCPNLVYLDLSTWIIMDSYHYIPDRSGNPAVCKFPQSLKYLGLYFIQQGTYTPCTHKQLCRFNLAEALVTQLFPGIDYREYYFTHLINHLNKGILYKHLEYDEHDYEGSWEPECYFADSTHVHNFFKVLIDYFTTGIAKSFIINKMYWVHCTRIYYTVQRHINTHWGTSSDHHLPLLATPMLNLLTNITLSRTSENYIESFDHNPENRGRRGPDYRHHHTFRSDEGDKHEHSELDVTEIDHGITTHMEKLVKLIGSIGGVDTITTPRFVYEIINGLFRITKTYINRLKQIRSNFMQQEEPLSPGPPDTNRQYLLNILKHILHLVTQNTQYYKRDIEYQIVYVIYNLFYPYNDCFINAIQLLTFNKQLSNILVDIIFQENIIDYNPHIQSTLYTYMFKSFDTLGKKKLVDVILHNFMYILTDNRDYFKHTKYIALLYIMLDKLDDINRKEFFNIVDTYAELREIFMYQVIKTINEKPQQIHHCIYNIYVYRILLMMIDTAPFSLFSHQENQYTDEYQIDYINIIRQTQDEKRYLNMLRLIELWMQPIKGKPPKMQLWNIALIVHMLIFYVTFGHRVALYDNVVTILCSFMSMYTHITPYCSQIKELLLQQTDTGTYEDKRHKQFSMAPFSTISPDIIYEPVSVDSNISCETISYFKDVSLKFNTNVVQKYFTTPPTDFVLTTQSLNWTSH